METKHTPGRLDLFPSRESICIGVFQPHSNLVRQVATCEPDDMADAARIVHCVNNNDALLAALEAIEARISGEWDNPALVSFGELSTNTDDDVLRIARAAIAAAKESTT